MELRQVATVIGSTGATLGLVNAVLPGRGFSFALAMICICVMAMIGAYFTITNRAYDGAPILLGCAASVAGTVLLYYFAPPLFALETPPVEGASLYLLQVAPSLLLFLSATLAYQLPDPVGERSGSGGTPEQ